MYKCLGEVTNKTPDEFNNFIEYSNNSNNLQIMTVQFGFTNTNKNPFDSIYFYDSKMTVYASSFLLDKKQISTLLCDIYVETKHFLMCKDREQYGPMLNLYKQYRVEQYKNKLNNE